MANYQTLFDASTVPFGYGSAAGMLVLGIIAIGFGVLRLRNMTAFGRFRGIRSLVLIIAGFGMFVFIGRDWWSYQSAQAAMSGGDGVEQIEGTVQDHWVKKQMHGIGDDAHLEKVEHFRIGQVEFEFTQKAGHDPFFTNTGPHATDLRDGMRLRIAYIADDDANKIVKLEVAK